MLSYGLVACPRNKSQTSSLYIVINRFFMKLFNSILMYKLLNIVKNNSALDYLVLPLLVSATVTWINSVIVPTVS